MPRVMGFILNFGYVESHKVSIVPVVTTNRRGYATVGKALRALANYIWDDYICRIKEHNSFVDKFPSHPSQKIEPTLKDFEDWLSKIPEMDASANFSWDVSHWNDEQWWPWDDLTFVIKHFGSMIYECHAEANGVESYLPYFIDVSKLEKYPEIIEELNISYNRRVCMKKLLKQFRPLLER